MMRSIKDSLSNNYVHFPVDQDAKQYQYLCPKYEFSLKGADENMKLKNVDENLRTTGVISTPVKLNHFSVSLKKVADSLEFRTAAVYEHQKTGELFTYKIYTITKPLGEDHYVIHCTGRSPVYKTTRQRAVETVLEKLPEDYGYMMNEKLQQIEDAAYFKRLVQQ